MFCGRRFGRGARMPGMFDANRPDPQAVRRIKALVAEHFELPDEYKTSGKLRRT